MGMGRFGGPGLGQRAGLGGYPARKSLQHPCFMGGVDLTLTPAFPLVLLVFGLLLASGVIIFRPGS